MDGGKTAPGHVARMREFMQQMRRRGQMAKAA